jgi:hypothetical protein
MRAQEIYEKIDKSGIEHFSKHFPSRGSITDLLELRSRIEHLNGIPGFDGELNSLSQSIIFRTTNNQIGIPAEEWQNILNVLNPFVTKLRGLKQYLGAFLARQDTNSVFVKAPPLTQFSDVIIFEGQLKTALSQIIYHPKVQARLELKSWESGSPLWLELALGTQAAVNIVGAAAWAGAVVYKKIQEGRLHQEYVRGLKLRNDSLEAILEAEKRMLNDIINAEAENIALSNYDGDNSQETIERVKLTIKEFAEMIEKGAEIHPALQAPEEVKNLFPNFKNLLATESKIKQLAENAGPK